MPSLARRNLLHDRVRLVVTLTGIVFAVVLSAVQLGLFVGFQRATSDVIRHAGADLWIASSGVTHLETGVPFSERKLYEVLATPGISAVQKHLVRFAQWKKPDGGQESVMVIGVDLTGSMGRPWQLVAGSADRLAEPDAVIVDELYLREAGHLGCWRPRRDSAGTARAWSASPAASARSPRRLRSSPRSSGRRTTPASRKTRRMYLLGRVAADASPDEVAGAFVSASPTSSPHR